MSTVDTELTETNTNSPKPQPDHDNVKIVIDQPTNKNNLNHYNQIQPTPSGEFYNSTPLTDNHSNSLPREQSNEPSNSASIYDTKGKNGTLIINAHYIKEKLLFKTDESESCTLPNIRNDLNNADVRTRTSRFIAIATLPSIFLLFVTYFHQKWELSMMLGIGVELMYITYFAHIGYLFFRGKTRTKQDQDDDDECSLYRIYTQTDNVDDWIGVKIATGVTLYKYKAIQSISEFSAIEGAIPSYMLNNLGPSTWTILVMHLAAQLQFNDEFQWDITDISQCIGVGGLVMIGIYELDAHHPAMQFLHYFGAACGTGTVWGYFIQQYSLAKKYGWTRLIAPIGLGLICFTFFILWRFVLIPRTESYEKKLEPQLSKFVIEKEKLGNNPQKEELVKWKNEIKKWEKETLCKSEITKWSIRNVVSEAIFLFMGASALSLWLIDYHHHCDIGCVGPD